MHIKSTLDSLLQQAYLHVPCNMYSAEHIAKLVGHTVTQKGDVWLVPCSHSVNPPATPYQITSAERSLGHKLPADLREFFERANGCDLYAVHQKRSTGGGSATRVPRYRIFDTDELVKRNTTLTLIAQSAFGNDPDFGDLTKLNYLAFCELSNANYIAILLDSPACSKLFFLDHALLYRPYTTTDAAQYYDVATSLYDWLLTIGQTGGWKGIDDLDGAL